LNNGAPTLADFPLVACRIANGALAADPLPQRLKLLNWGRNDSTKGPVLLDEISAQALAANQRALGFDRVALDYEHNTVPGTPEYERTREPRDVAAYGTPVVIPGDGLYLENLQWTPSGRASAKNYADLSPAPSRDAEGRVVFLHSAALVRNGAVFDLSFFSATPTPKAMTDTLTLADLATALGLDAQAPRADVLTKLSAALKPAPVDLTPLTARIETIEKARPSGGAGVTLEAFAALEARVKDIEAARTTDQTAAEQREREALIAEATREGKLIPLTAEQIKTVPLDTFKALVAGLPKNVVPLHARIKPVEGARPGAELKGFARALAAHQAESK
jgi:phage I-like protein